MVMCEWTKSFTLTWTKCGSKCSQACYWLNDIDSWPLKAFIIRWMMKKMGIVCHPYHHNKVPWIVLKETPKWRMRLKRRPKKLRKTENFITTTLGPFIIRTHRCQFLWWNAYTASNYLPSKMFCYVPVEVMQNCCFLWTSFNSQSRFHPDLRLERWIVLQFITYPQSHLFSDYHCVFSHDVIHFNSDWVWINFETRNL